MSDPQNPIAPRMPDALLPLLPMPRWLLWNWMLKAPSREGKPRDPNRKDSWTKPPLCADPDGSNARACHTDRDADLRPYAEVASAWASGKFFGVGFAPRAGDGLLFLDLDNCRDKATGVLAPWAQAVVAAAKTYTEVSPSGTGLRLIGTAEGYAGRDTKTSFVLPEQALGTPGGTGEVYQGSNYVTVTFMTLGPETGARDELAPLGAVANDILSRSVTRTGVGGNGAGVMEGAPPVLAPADVIRETLGAIPNEAASWCYWKERIGMAVYAATGGSDEGFALWDDWSRRAPCYGQGSTCEEEWFRMSASPPTRSDGFGTLFAEARAAEAKAGRRWVGGAQWRLWKAREAGMGALPVGFGAPREEKEDHPGGDAEDGGLSGAPAAPTIQVVAGRLAETVDAAEQALLGGGFAVYLRGDRLVVPTSHSVRVRGGGQATATGLREIGLAAMRDLLSRAATWVTWDARGQKLKAIDPPGDIAAALLDRPAPRPFPGISGVTATPGMLDDGMIVGTTGHDAALGVHRTADPFLLLPAGWPAGPAVKADAEAGLALLGGLLVGFPFVEDVDRSVALAFLLTCLCRSTVPLAPIFAISATDAGTGKSHLVDLGSALATGRRCPAASAGETAEELDKRLTGLIAAGYPVVSLDNVNGTIRSDILNQAVEREMIRIRPLGRSDIMEVESRAVFTANGNGIRLSGDLVRRTLPCRLDAAVERPETRTFTFDPVVRVEAGRGAYVAAGLDALRAHAAAGLPGAAGLQPLGSYEAWSRHVRGTLVWLGYPDPALAMDRARADDPDLRTLRDMLQGWAKRLGTERAYTTGEAIGAALGGGSGQMSQVVGGRPEDTNARGDLLDAMLRAAPAKGGAAGGIDAQRMGTWLSRNVGRIVGGLRFEQASTQMSHTAQWHVVRTRPELRLVSG